MGRSEELDRKSMAGLIERAPPKLKRTYAITKSCNHLLVIYTPRVINI